MNGLDDKTALITGGGRGIGRAIALQLAQRGDRVAVAARSGDELVETTSAIAASGGRVHAIVADLAAPGAGMSTCASTRPKSRRHEGALVEREQCARCRISEAACARPRR